VNGGAVSTARSMGGFLRLHRDPWVRMRARVKIALQGLALAHG